MSGLLGVEIAGNTYKRSQLEDVSHGHAPRVTVTLGIAGTARTCSRGEVLCMNTGTDGGYEYYPQTSTGDYVAKLITEESVLMSTAGTVQTVAIAGPARIMESDVIYPAGTTDAVKNKTKDELRDRCIILSASDFEFA